MREIGDIVRAFEQRPRDPFALATLVEVQGSGYRRPGARMLVNADGEANGSLSGGCLEEEVVDRAHQVLGSGRPAVMDFDTGRKFGCNGKLRILVEPMSENFLGGLAENFHARRPFVIASSYLGEYGSRFVESAERSLPGEFRQRIEPDIQLLILGAGADSVAMVAIARALGWRIHCFGAANELAPIYDRWTAAVIKTHNYGRDFAALRTLIPLDLAYIGLMGPRARRERLLGDLLDTGLTVGANLFAPAGLDLGGDSPETIALAIVAEIEAVMAGGSGQSLRGRKAPIHARENQALASVL